MEVDYQRALELALPKFGVEFEREVEIPIVYDGVTETARRVDFVCWDESRKCFVNSSSVEIVQG